MVENITLLEELLQKEPSINESIKSFILLEDDTDSGEMCLDFVEYRDKLFTWNEMLQRGKLIDDSVLEEREEQQAVNLVFNLMLNLMYTTSGTTANPKGIDMIS